MLLTEKETFAVFLNEDKFQVRVAYRKCHVNLEKQLRGWIFLRFILSHMRPSCRDSIENYSTVHIVKRQNSRRFAFKLKKMHLHMNLLGLRAMRIDSFVRRWMHIWMLRGLYRSDIHHHRNVSSTVELSGIFVTSYPIHETGSRSVNTTRFAELSTNTHFHLLQLTFFFGPKSFSRLTSIRKVLRSHKTTYLIWLFTSLGRRKFEYRVIFVITLWVSACVHNRDVIFRSHVQQSSCHLTFKSKEDSKLNCLKKAFVESWTREIVEHYH